VAQPLLDDLWMSPQLDHQTRRPVRRERIERRWAPLREVLTRAVERGELPVDLDLADTTIDLVAPVPVSSGATGSVA
jgi:hypothetical protein